MLSKFRELVAEFRVKVEHISSQNEKLKLQLAELEWANVFHDTINGNEWLKNLSISPGRWAGNYSFFYILVRILSDYRPTKIIEFGLGESSKVVSTFIENELNASSHIILEQDSNWIDAFNLRYSLSNKSTIRQLPLKVININGYSVNTYDEVVEKVQGVFDFYIVDGPFGSNRYSRYDIFLLAQTMTLNDEFIILMDDYNRPGEMDTVNDLLFFFREKKFQIFTGIYAGVKSQIVIATGKYRLAVSM